MSHRQYVSLVILNDLSSMEPSSDYMAYKNIIWTFTWLEITTDILLKLMLTMKMQRSNIYHIKEK